MFKYNIKVYDMFRSFLWDTVVGNTLVNFSNYNYNSIIA
jgi:hypothetical protein